MGSYQLVPTWGNKLTDLVLLYSSLSRKKKKRTSISELCSNDVARFFSGAELGVKQRKTKRPNKHYLSLKRSDPAALSSTATLLRLHSSH